MKPETMLTKDQIENFSINVVDDFEGCKEATVFLRRIYGDRNMDLRQLGSDFESLVRMGKSLWIIYFLLNTITKPFRVKFISGLISDHLWMIKCEETSKEIINCLGRIQTYTEDPNNDLYDDLAHDDEYLSEKRENIKEEIKSLGDISVSVQEEKFQDLMTESQLLKGILFTLRDSGDNLTQSSCKLVQSLAEANQWKFMRESAVDYNKKTLESCALTLIEYVGYFVVTQEKEV